MRLLTILTLVGLSFYGQGQTTIDSDIIDCIVDSYNQENFDIRKTLDNFEAFLVKNKYMIDKSGQSYLSVYKQIADDNDVNITLDNFNDNGLLQKPPISFFDCYRTRLPEIIKSESPLKKLFKQFQDNPIDPASPGEASKYLLKVLKPDDFKHDVIRYYSLYTLLFTSLPDFSNQLTTTDKELSISKEYEKKIVVRLDKESKLFINGKPTNLDTLKKTLSNFLTPSMDTLKIVTLESSRATLYKDFSKTLEIIQAQFQLARERTSDNQYHQEFDSLTDDKKEIIRRLLPIRINVTDPK
jgi:hypothetical protein